VRGKQIKVLIECEVWINGHTQKSVDFETILWNFKLAHAGCEEITKPRFESQWKLTTHYSISTESFKAVVAGL